MAELLKEIAACVEAGKVDKASPYPPAMNGQDGADEITRKALEAGFTVDEILEQGLMAGMDKVGCAFRDNIIFVPQVLMSARAMSAAMAHLKPHFASGAPERKGTFIIGTVEGDLHDIGKNLVAMMMEGAGFEVVDIGINNDVDAYLEALATHKPDILGMSALLTTTMPYMKVVIDELVKQGIRDDYIVLVGGAPLNEDFGRAVGADGYCRDAAQAAEMGPQLLRERRAAVVA